MGNTTVINLRSGKPYHVYIGRACPTRRLAASPWANPFKLVGPGRMTRAESIAAYRRYLVLDRPDLIVLARQLLAGRVLACWCEPEPCHGDVLVEWILVQDYGATLPYCQECFRPLDRTQARCVGYFPCPEHPTAPVGYLDLPQIDAAAGKRQWAIGNGQ